VTLVTALRILTNRGTGTFATPNGSLAGETGLGEKVVLYKNGMGCVGRRHHPLESPTRLPNHLLFSVYQSTPPSRYSTPKRQPVQRANSPWHSRLPRPTGSTSSRRCLLSHSALPARRAVPCSPTAQSSHSTRPPPPRASPRLAPATSTPSTPSNRRPWWEGAERFRETWRLGACLQSPRTGRRLAAPRGGRAKRTRGVRCEYPRTLSSTGPDPCTPRRKLANVSLANIVATVADATK
jgi:hypothetical protein